MNEYTITPEMMAAGLECFEQIHRPDLPMVKTDMSLIYRAMHHARPEPPNKSNQSLAIGRYIPNPVADAMKRYADACEAESKSQGIIATGNMVSLDFVLSMLRKIADDVQLERVK